MNIVDLLLSIGKLKTLKRRGWVLYKVKNPESVADHSFRTAVMALLLADGKLDKNKCIQMALIHDLAESIVGDITPWDGIHDKEKHRREKEAFEFLFKDFDKNILYLWNEYDERKTPESKFVYELDKIEAILQAFEYEKSEGIDLSEFYSHNGEKLKDPKVLKILKILQNSRDFVKENSKKTK